MSMSMPMPMPMPMPAFVLMPALTLMSTLIPMPR
jgi:hypothetical protein